MWSCVLGVVVAVCIRVGGVVVVVVDKSTMFFDGSCPCSLLVRLRGCLTYAPTLDDMEDTFDCNVLVYHCLDVRSISPILCTISSNGL